MRRKKPEDRSQQWQPRRSVRLYLDDIEEIFAVLARLGGSVNAETEDFTDIKEPDELRQIGESTKGQINNLIIKAGPSAPDEEPVVVAELKPEDALSPTTKVVEQWAAVSRAALERWRTGVDLPQITVHLRKPVHVRISSDDNELVGASQRIQSILEQRMTRLGGWNEGSWGVVTGVIGGALTFALAKLSPSVESAMEANFWIFVSVFAAFTFAAICLQAAFGKNSAPNARIITKTRAEAPTFWEQHRVDIAINVATTLLGLLLGLWLGD